MKKLLLFCLILLLCAQPLSVCEDVVPPEDGLYLAEFHTDSSMFHVSEAYGSMGLVRVENGEMTIHVTLNSKNIVNLFYGLAEDAKKEDAALIQPSLDTVVFPDGWIEVVFGFDIPVPAVNTEFQVALIGKKGKWYDHKVYITNLIPAADADEELLSALVASSGFEVTE